MPPAYGSVSSSYGSAGSGVAPGYYLPGYDYGNTIPGIENSPLSDIIMRQNWQIAFDYMTGGAGLNPSGAFSNFVRGQEPLMERAFRAALIRNPQLEAKQFLGQYIGQPGQGAEASLRNTWQSLPYQLRSENPGEWGQGRTEWVRRNN